MDIISSPQKGWQSDREAAYDAWLWEEGEVHQGNLKKDSVHNEMNPVQIHRIVFAVGLPEPHSYNHSAYNPTADF